MEKIGFFGMLSIAYNAIGRLFSMVDRAASAGDIAAKALEVKANELLQGVEMESQQNLAKLKAEFEAWEAKQAANKQQQ